ncbi:MAG: cell division protein SepF [Candidatus Diapherotrites archaeon]|nr:cell division protein SepF [Candidatus Diapherotrites archaeon]
MAFFEKILKREEEVNIEEILNSMDSEEEFLYEDADAYVVPVSLQTEEDVAKTIEQVKQGNVVLLNISDLLRRNTLKLREYVDDIKNSIGELDGDIARITEDRILITPSRVKIIKRHKRKE